MAKKIKKPLHRSEARDALDALVNTESMDMVDRMVKHREITIEDAFAGKTISEKDIIDIDIGYIIQEIAGLKVLLRGDLAKTKTEYEEASPEDILSAPLTSPKGEA